MKFDELYKKVINASRAFDERQVPIHLDFKIEDLRDALVETNDTIEKLVGAKKSAEQILQNLLDCGLIKEWYFNGKFNAVLKADDPHLQIAELKAKIIKSKELADGIRCDIEKVKADAAETLALLEERNKQVGELNAKLDSMTQQFSKYVVDANNRERRLRRLLWHAIALFCARSCEYFNGIMSHCLMGQDDLYKRCEEKKNKYLNATNKCRAKEKEYK